MTDVWSSATGAGLFDKQLTLVSRRVQPDVRAVDAIVRVVANEQEMREALREFDTRLALSLGLLWLVLSLAAYAQVSLGLRPPDRLRHELDRLRRSPAARPSGDRKSVGEGKSVAVRGDHGGRRIIKNRHARGRREY